MNARDTKRPGRLSLERLQRRARRTALLAMLGVAPMMAGCYGNFPLTKMVYNFNGSVFDNKFATSILFWVLVILPVYDLAMLGDAVIFNLIEFWTGDTIEISRAKDAHGNTVVVTPAKDGESATVEVTSPSGEPLYEGRFVKASDGWAIEDADGARVGTVAPTAAGGFEVRGPEGTVLRTIGSETVAAAQTS